MSTKLFIGKLSFDTTETSLTELFKQYGALKSVAIVLDRVTNKSRGFGFVEMEDDAAAKKAIAELNGKDFEGQEIIVNVARTREDRPNNQSGFRRSW